VPGRGFVRQKREEERFHLCSIFGVKKDFTVFPFFCLTNPALFIHNDRIMRSCHFLAYVIVIISRESGNTAKIIRGCISYTGEKQVSPIHIKGIVSWDIDGLFMILSYSLDVGHLPLGILFF
jgi:hypothetical protein